MPNILVVQAISAGRAVASAIRWLVRLRAPAATRALGRRRAPTNRPWWAGQSSDHSSDLQNTPMLTIEIIGNGIPRLADAAQTLGSEAKARTAYSRAINHSAKVAATATGRALSDQTGLPKRTGKKALNLKVDRSTPATLTYTIHTRGGDISLKYFKPRETRPGVSAAPWNSRRVYPSTFMRAGWWPRRVNKPGWNGQVFIRTGAGKSFKVADSGLFIPIEVVQGASAAAWNTGAAK